MSYIKSLKKSPFKSLTITLGKLPDGGVYQNVFVTQDEEPKFASFDCPSYASSDARKSFLPLVKEALRRAQSIEELADLLKPFAVEPTAPVKESSYKTGEQCASAALPVAAKQQGVLKVELLYMLMKNDDHSQAIEAVLNSGLLPEPQLQQWLDNLVERAVRRMLGRSGCPEWEDWAARWLSGEDRTEEAARAAWAAARAAAWAARAARAAAWAARAARAVARAAGAAGAAARAAGEAGAAARVAGEAAWAARAAAAWVEEAAGEAAERKAQYDDLLNLINDL